MYTLVLTIHLVLAVVLIGLVLLQQGKGADVGAIMGSSGSNSLFGASGASNFLIRLTTGVAIGFMFTSVMLIRLAASGPAVRTTTAPDPMRGSALEGVAANPADAATATPAAATPAAAPAADVTPQAMAPVAQGTPARK